MPTMNINRVAFRYTEAEATYAPDLVFQVSHLRLRQSLFFASEFCTCMGTEFWGGFLFGFFFHMKQLFCMGTGFPRNEG